MAYPHRHNFVHRPSVPGAPVKPAPPGRLRADPRDIHLSRIIPREPPHRPSLIPAEQDFLYISVYHRNAPPKTLCHLCDHPEPHQLPTFGSQETIKQLSLQADKCGHWYHIPCLWGFLSNDEVPPRVAACEYCRLIHHAARWYGPLQCSLKERFPGSQ
jgi:hypothetical protein